MLESLPVGTRVVPAQRYLGLEQVARGILDTSDAPSGAGYAMAVVHRGEVLAQLVLGLRDREAHAPVTSETVFPLASISKGITSTALLLAEQQGRISLTRPMRELSSLLRFADPEAERSASLCDVLGHRTGIPAHDLLWYLVAQSPRELAAAVRFLPPISSGFRTTFAYNNVLYGALAPVLEDLLGESFDTFLRRLISGPLSLRGLCVGGLPHTGPNGAAPYLGVARLAGRDLQSIAPGGGLCGSLEDMIAWLRALTSSGSSYATALERALRTPSDASAMNPAWLQGWTSTRALAYGLGWFVADLRGERMAFQPGFCAGFSTSLAVVPERELGVVVLSNQHLTPLPGRLAEALLAATLGLPGPALVAAEPAQREVISERLHEPVSLEWSGTYFHSAYGELVITREAAHTRGTLGGRPFELSRDGDGAVLHVSLDGFELPLPVARHAHRNELTRLGLPLGLDARAPLVVFQKNAQDTPHHA